LKSIIVLGKVLIPTAIVPKQNAPGKAMLYPMLKPKAQINIKGNMKAIIGPEIDLQKYPLINLKMVLVLFKGRCFSKYFIIFLVLY
jgi:hypothetical protein